MSVNLVNGPKVGRYRLPKAPFSPLTEPLLGPALPGDRAWTKPCAQWLLWATVPGRRRRGQGRGRQRRKESHREACPPAGRLSGRRGPLPAGRCHVHGGGDIHHLWGGRSVGQGPSCWEYATSVTHRRGHQADSRRVSGKPGQSSEARSQQVTPA